MGVKGGGKRRRHNDQRPQRGLRSRESAHTRVDDPDRSVARGPAHGRHARRSRAGAGARVWTVGRAGAR